MSGKEYIDINPLEEILKAIGIVQGKDVEYRWRYLLRRLGYKV